MSDRTKKNENNAFLKLVKGKNSYFEEIEEDTEHLRIDNNMQKWLDELKLLTNEQIKEKDRQSQELNQHCDYELYSPRCLSMGNLHGEALVLYKYVLHIVQNDANNDFECEYARMIAKNCEYDYYMSIAENNFSHGCNFGDCDGDADNILNCLDWSDVDHYYSPMYLEMVRKNKFKKFIVPSMEIEAESEEEAKQIAASRLVVTSV